jgi:RHS repeat-associated protein
VTTTTVTSPASTLPATSLSLAGLTLSSTDQHGCTTIYGYDALLRQISAESRSGPNNERLSGAYTHYNLIGQVDYTEDAFGSRTVFTYDSIGRKVAQTFLSAIDSLSNSTYTAYDSAGRTLATWGATYPVAYEYDTAGRMTAMYTYRGTNEAEFVSQIRQSGTNALTQFSDRTQWLYDQATGLLTNKLYADGKGPAYSYTALGQLATRKWARLDGQTPVSVRLLTSYKYDSFGALTNTAYSDGTPSVSFTINALGQIKTVSDASGTRAINYASDGQMIAETLAFNTSLFTVHEKFDTLGRNVGYALSNAVAQITGTMQSFDQYGRLNQVAVDGISGAFTYGYLEGTHLQKTLAMPNGVTRTFGYEPNRDLITMIVHSNATDRLVQRDFTFDGLGRLSNRTLLRANETPVNPDAFGYNLRSELTNAVIGANTFAYNFDPIGNRLASIEFGTNTAYVASALNQYTSINPINPVNPVENFTPEFDLDGNQTLLKTTTGIWHVTYNAENRPILFSNDTTVVEMAYDYMGRRFEYRETVSSALTRHERYLYRGYLQIVALDMLDSASVKHTFAWDPTEPTVTRPVVLQIGANAYYYSFDQVKNVTELFDSTGTFVATYEYSPFGQLTSALSVGSSAFDVASNPITFSSEVFDASLGLQYYNYRHLNLLDGRWVNRDPINNWIVLNLYFHSDNNSLGNLDVLGLLIVDDSNYPDPKKIKPLFRDNVFFSSPRLRNTVGTPSLCVVRYTAGVNTVKKVTCSCTCDRKTKKSTIKCKVGWGAEIILNEESLGWKKKPDTSKNVKGVPSEKMKGAYGHEQLHIQARNDEILLKVIAPLKGERSEWGILSTENRKCIENAEKYSKDYSKILREILSDANTEDPHGKNGHPEANTLYPPLAGSVWPEKEDEKKEEGEEGGTE